MAGFCLTPKIAEDLKKKFVSGEINPEKLTAMSSKERRAFFVEHVGEANAEPVNRLFESKLILKNQQQGMITWAKKLVDVTPEIRRDLMSKIQRLDKVLEPHDEQAFLEDLASYKLGTRVSFEEARTISDLSNKVEDTREAMERGGDRLDYGRSLVDLQNYVSDLKNASTKTTLADFKANPVGETGKTLAKGLVKAPGFFKAVQSSFDDSALFRQGWKTLWTNPVIWQRNARKSFVDIAKTLGGKNVTDELQADIQSRPNNDLYKKAKLDIGNMEEAFPTTLPEKVPILGRAYKASEAAYTNFLHKTRADVFDKMIDIAKKSDVELTNTELVQIGRLVNSLTGRGHLGSLERAGAAVNNLFFSPKNIKAHLDVLTQPLTGGATAKEMAEGEAGSAFVRKQAALNLMKVIGGTAAVLAIAKAINPDSVDFDPRSSNFGKIKVRGTRFDVTGGMGSIATLAARLVTASTKSSVTGKVRDLNERDKNGKPKFGAPTMDDLVIDFLSNKLSPAARVALDFGKGQTFEGDKPTIQGEALSLVTPLPVKNVVENFKDPNAAPLLATIIADGLGIGANTYGGSSQIRADIKKAVQSGDREEVERLTAALKVALQNEAVKKKNLKQSLKGGED